MRGCWKRRKKKIFKNEFGTLKIAFVCRLSILPAFISVSQKELKPERRPYTHQEKKNKINLIRNDPLVFYFCQVFGWFPIVHSCIIAMKLLSVEGTHHYLSYNNTFLYNSPQNGHKYPLGVMTFHFINQTYKHILQPSKSAFVLTPETY